MIEITDVKEPTLETLYKENELNGTIFRINDGKICGVVRRSC